MLRSCAICLRVIRFRAISALISDADIFLFLDIHSSLS